jgi:TPR repeat protein
MCLITRDGLARDITAAIRYFTLYAENGGSDGQAVVGWMMENGINSAPEIAADVCYYELSVPHLIAVLFTWVVAAELFDKAAVFGDADSANSFSCCLERDEGVDQTIELAVEFYHKGHSLASVRVVQLRTLS